MKIAIASDLHLDHRPKQWRTVVENIAAVDADVLVLAGDIAEIINHPWFDGLSLLAGAFKNVIYVLGNHEYYNTPARKYRVEIKELEKAFLGLHILEERVIDIDGVTFAGTSLWFDADEPTAYLQSSRLNDFRLIPDAWKRIRVSRKESIDFLKDLSKVDVVVTHHAPTYKCVAPRFAGSSLNIFFANQLDQEIERLSPKYWIHGHMHDPVDTQIAETRVIANPLGYPHESLEWKPVVIEI
ncbi:MAG: metallophosphoesterase [Cyanobacteria bacterium P01_F01_bin.13]